MATNSDTTTQIYKTVDGLSLSLDITKPTKVPPGGQLVALIHFHRGFLVGGEKTTVPPHWLINACLRRGWIYITPSYRLLPEAKGADLIDDAVDVVTYVKGHIAQDIFVAGSSAGGYLAFAATANTPHRESIRGVLTVYGLLDPCGPRYTTPGTNFMDQPPVDTKKLVAAMNKSAKEGKVIDGYAYPANHAEDERWQWVEAIHQEALYPDILSGIDGLAARIRAYGVDSIPTSCHKTFPVLFDVGETFPPTVLIHGDKDNVAPHFQSNYVADKLSYLGGRVQLELARGQGHGFDVEGIPADIDVDADHADDDDRIKHLKAAMHFLDLCLE